MLDKSKFKSRKLWVTIWSMVIVTFIIIANRSEFKEIANVLCFVPIAFIGGNVWQKKIFSDKEIKGGEQ